MNHAMLMKVEAERDEMLARLSIGKKAVESRPLDFDVVLQRAKLVMACAWPDQVYLRSRDGYRVDHPDREPAKPASSSKWVAIPSCPAEALHRN